jgi:bifunctional non-homologous end joining protein LigD
MRPLFPADRPDVVVELAGREVKLTNLDKPFWPKLGVRKRDLLQYYAEVAPVLLPHIRDRPMVMKRYPNGAGGEFFFMKRAPSPRPDWIAICSVRHRGHGTIDYPLIQDLPSLLWVVNLGCIDLNPFYARCDDVDRPDYVCFDLDPGSAPFARVAEAALILREALGELGMPALVKTTGQKGLHVYVPIVRGPRQKEVWRFAKALADVLAARHPGLMTTAYSVARRPAGRVLVDYNQNAWGRTLASVYSVRPTDVAGVSTPVTWSELERGVRVEDFRIDNVPARVRRHGDLWKPLLARTGRFELTAVL